MIGSTTVMNVRAFRGDPRKIDGFEYVGRKVPRGGWRQSPYANPYKPDYGDDDFLTDLDCVAMFTGICLVKRSADLGPEYLATLRRRLRGKSLACWCTEWNPDRYMVQPCHAIPLALTADGADPIDVLAWLVEVRGRYHRAVGDVGDGEDRAEAPLP